MKTVFSQSKQDISKNLIQEKLSKTRGVSSCLLAAISYDEHIAHNYLYDVLWAINDDLKEIENLYEKLVDLI